jgi:hypothetical protein
MYNNKLLLANCYIEEKNGYDNEEGKTNINFSLFNKDLYLFQKHY